MSITWATDLANTVLIRDVKRDPINPYVLNIPRVTMRDHMHHKDEDNIWYYIYDALDGRKCKNGNFDDVSNRLLFLRV